MQEDKLSHRLDRRDEIILVLLAIIIPLATVPGPHGWPLKGMQAEAFITWICWLPPSASFRSAYPAVD